jgi:hypothetical protein
VTDHAKHRLLFALAASMLTHAVLMQAVEGAAARRARSAAVASLTATLTFSRGELSERAFETPTLRLPQGQPAELPLTKQQHSVAAIAVPAPVLRPARSEATVSTQGDAVVTQVSDPTYYGARSLDLYPKALTVIDLNGFSGKSIVHATVFIDEYGMVNEVRAIKAENIDVENAARDLLMRTRFSPAVKEGRAVKAQLVMSLTTSASVAP